MLRKRNMLRTLLLAALLGAAIIVGLLSGAVGGEGGLGFRIWNSALVGPASFGSDYALARSMVRYGLTDPGKVTQAMKDAASDPVTTKGVNLRYARMAGELTREYWRRGTMVAVSALRLASMYHVRPIVLTHAKQLYVRTSIPEPTSTPTPTPTPTVTPTPTPTPTPSYTSMATPTGAPTPTYTPTPTPTPTYTPTPTPTPEPVPVPTPTETPTPTPTPTATTTPAPAATYNVMNYGAKGDGVTNDAPAFRLAVTAASNAGGGIVYVPAGSYRFTTVDPYNSGVEGGYIPEASYNVTLKDHVHIEGAGTALTTITGALSGAHPFGADHKTDVGVSHLKITSTASEVDGVKFLQSDNVTIDDVHVSGLYIGIALYSSTNSVVKNSSATGCSGFGFVSGEADVLGYSGRTRNVLITHSTASGNAVNFRVRGTMLSVAAPYTLRSDAPLRNSGTTISYSTSTNWGNAGYYLTYSDHLVMSYNTDDRTTWDSIQAVGVINSEFHQNTGTITQINQSNPPAGYGSSSGNTVD